MGEGVVFRPESGDLAQEHPEVLTEKLHERQVHQAGRCLPRLRQERGKVGRDEGPGGVNVLAMPLSYPMARGDAELVNFINTWIELKTRDRTIATLYDYWILGKNAVPQPPC